MTYSADDIYKKYDCTKEAAEIFAPITIDWMKLDLMPGENFSDRNKRVDESIQKRLDEIQEQLNNQSS